jgi:hypothetical protein
MRKRKLSVELLTVESFAVTEEAAPVLASLETTGGPWHCPYACGSDDSGPGCC